VAGTRISDFSETPLRCGYLVVGSCTAMKCGESAVVAGLGVERLDVFMIRLDAH
jgi:hypothetical protein